MLTHPGDARANQVTSEKGSDDEESDRSGDDQPPQEGSNSDATSIQKSVIPDGKAYIKSALSQS